MGINVKGVTMSGYQEKKNALRCAQIVNLLIGINLPEKNNFFEFNNSRLRYNVLLCSLSEKQDIKLK